MFQLFLMDFDPADLRGSWQTSVSPAHLLLIIANW